MMNHDGDCDDDDDDDDYDGCGGGVGGEDNDDDNDNALCQRPSWGVDGKPPGICIETFANSTYPGLIFFHCPSPGSII